MNYFLLGSLTLTILFVGCSRKSEVAMSNSPKSQNQITAPIEQLVKKMPDQTSSAEHDLVMRQNFRNSEMIYQDGKVIVTSGDADSIRQAAMAQTILESEGYAIRNGAKIFLVEETDFNRLIWQELLEDGTPVGEVTLLLEKGTNKRLLGVTGFYSGPLP